MKTRLLIILVAVLLPSVAGCRPSVEAACESCPEAELVLNRAKADLAERLSASVDEVTVASVAPTECLTAEGAAPCYVVRLMVWDTVFTYQGSEDCVLYVADSCQASGSCITIDCVQVTDGQISFCGLARLENGTCVQTQLLADGIPEAWWPADACASVEDGYWSISVSLGERGAPEQLDRALAYTLRASQQGNAYIQAEPLWFDLAGPATLLSTPCQTRN